jgi:ketosteroid isomerase-like protein
MKFLLAVPLLAFALLAGTRGFVSAQTATNVAPPEVTAAAAAFDKAFRAGEGDAVAALLADDLISTGVGGRVENKKQFLDDYLPMAQQLASKQVSFDTFQRSNVQARAYGKVVVLTGGLDVLSHISGVPASNMEPVHYRFTQVWASTPSGWKLAVVQNSLIPKSTSSQPLP